MSDRKWAVACALSLAATMGGFLAFKEGCFSKAPTDYSGRSVFLAMVSRDSVGRAFELLEQNGIRLYMPYGSRAVQCKVAEEDYRRATDLLSEDAIARDYSVSFSGFLGERPPACTVREYERRRDELLQDPELGEATPLGAVLRHAVLALRAKEFPIVSRIETLTYDLDSTSLRTDVFWFYEIRLAKPDGSCAPPLHYQFQDGRWPIRVREKFYAAVRSR